MADPKFTDYINPLISALKALGGAAKPQDVCEYIARSMNLADEVINRQNQSGGSRFLNGVNWAKFYLLKSGFIESVQRGVWSLSEKGRENITHFSEQQINQLVKVVQSQSKKTPSTLSSQTEITEIDINSLRIAIVEILKNKSHKSCKRDNLPAEVRRYLGTNLRGKARSAFDHQVTNALSRLKQSNLVEQYRSSQNVRVRLKSLDISRYDKLISNWKDKATANDNISTYQDNKHIMDNFKLYDDIDNRSINNNLGDFNTHSKPIINLPILDDIVDPGTFEAPDDNHEEGDIQHDDETKQLLGTLTKDSPYKEHTSKEDLSRDSDILAILKSNLDSTPNLKTERILNTIKIIVDVSPDPLEFELEYQPELENILIRSYFRITNRNPARLLELCGKDNFTATLGITKRKDSKVYIVHKTLSLHLFGLKQVHNIIMHFLTEINDVNKIIRV